jgi:hypothetical protein
MRYYERFRRRAYGAEGGAPLGTSSFVQASADRMPLDDESQVGPIRSSCSFPYRHFQPGSHRAGLLKFRLPLRAYWVVGPSR